MKGLFGAACLLGAASARFTEGTVSKGDEPLVVIYFPEWGVWAQAYKVSDFERGVIQRSLPIRNLVVNIAFLTLGYGDCRIGPTDQGAEWNSVDENFHQYNQQAWWTTGEWQNGYGPDGAWTSILALKTQKYPYMKFIPSIGGWSASQSFSHCVADAQLRKNTVGSIVDVVRYFGFDGIDFDWEYPNCDGTGGCGCQKEPTCPESSNEASANDWENYKLLIQETRAGLDSIEETLGKRLYLTAALGTNPKLIDGEAPWSAPTPIDWICDTDYFDWVNLMTYDYYGPWSNKTGHLAPLYKTDRADADEVQLSIDESVQKILAKCSRPEKLMMGLATYGKTWAQVPEGDGDIPGLYQISQNTNRTAIEVDMSWGNFGTWELGTVSWFDVKRRWIPNCDRYWDDDAKAPVLYCKDTPPDRPNYPQYNDEWRHNTFVTYEDGESWKEKMHYARKNKMGGAIIWSAADFGKVSMGEDEAVDLLQGMLDGWYGEGKATVNPTPGAGTHPQRPAKDTLAREYQFPCPIPHTSDVKPGGDTSLMHGLPYYHDWKNTKTWENPCYDHDWSSSRYPVVNVDLGRDNFGQDVIMILPTVPLDEDDDHSTKHHDDDDDDDDWPEGCPTPPHHKKKKTTTPGPDPEEPTTTPAPEPEPTTAAPEPEPTTAPEPESTTAAPEPEEPTTTPAPEPEEPTTTPAPEPEEPTTTPTPGPSPDDAIAQCHDYFKDSSDCQNLCDYYGNPDNAAFLAPYPGMSLPEAINAIVGSVRCPLH